MVDAQPENEGLFGARYVDEGGERYVHLWMREGTPEAHECQLSVEEAQGLGMYLVRLWYREGGPASDAPERMATLLRWLAASLEQA